VVLNVWTIYAAVVSRNDRSSPAITSWAIVNLQTGLMFNFYRIRCLTTEELLITVRHGSGNWAQQAQRGQQAWPLSSSWAAGIGLWMTRP
jgi:hypothetical protein